MATQNETFEPEMISRGYLRDRTPFDWVFAALCVLGYIAVLSVYGEAMGLYEHSTLLIGLACMVAIGWTWPPSRVFMIVVSVLAAFAVARYPTLAGGEEDFFLRYLLSSQSAIMWMCALFLAATVVYLAALIARSEFAGKVATAFVWIGSGAGLLGLLVRWHETYLLYPGYGYIPVSNLYEVFVLFAFTTGLLYLFYEWRYRTRALGGFVMLVVSAAILFLLWYHFDRGAHEIEPLIPALQSWWMKIHVPTNFVAYGSFAVSAMVGVAYLAKLRRPDGAILRQLPSLEQMDDLMYKTIALGFAFFTLATILGALWAAEAWGGYWTWDPKETWSLIVWLNYAAWLHLRFTKGWRGAPMAWWSVIGLAVTTFCFLGVNIFLSGLHSYGAL